MPPKYGGELSYAADDQSIDATPNNDWGVTLDIDWRPAASYDGYVEDRNGLGKPDQITLLGVPALTWAYSGDDHTAIREVVGDWTLEVRGSGMDEADYLALLDELTPVAVDDLDTHLPASFVTDAERPGVIADMLEPIPLPDGFDPASIQSTEIDPYQLGAAVTGAVTCAWLDQYTEARQTGDATGVQEAADAMATSRDWPVLKEMEKSGDWPDAVWGLADHMAAGDAPKGWAAQIGCEAQG